jgi:2-polyprenyl-3-methyl-5-hydroxy-6-metoxy-1,4-benzoquinol methylase
MVAEAALERPDCPLCGEAAGGEPRYRFPPYGVVRCGGCGFWYLSPRLREERMRDAYAHDSYFEGAGVGYRSYLAQEKTLRLTFRRFLRELARRGIGGRREAGEREKTEQEEEKQEEEQEQAGRGAGGRLLEIGCAYGFFLEEARASFAYRAGTDYSPAALALARARAERVYLGGAESVVETEPFDCVACIHVIEHVYEPRRLVADLAARLRPGGWLVLATPNMGSLWRPLMRRRWPFFKAPEHVTYFDRRSLARLLRGCGFTSVQTVPYASVFSLDMVGEKLGWQVPAFARRLRLWLPGTTIAAAGRKPAG